MEIRPAEISEILKQQIASFDTEANVAETGQVLSVGDGIARIFGLQNVLPLVYKSGLSQAGIDQLNAVSAKLDSATLLSLDYKNAGQGEDPATVATAWLKSEGLI